MLNLIKKILLKIVDDIDAGNSNISEKEAFELTKVLQSYTDKTSKLSKYQACQYLNMSRASFDNYVREGKIPQGKKEAGFKEKFWIKKDLDNIKKKVYDNRKDN